MQTQLLLARENKGRAFGGMCLSTCLTCGERGAEGVAVDLNAAAVGVECGGVVEELRVGDVGQRLVGHGGALDARSLGQLPATADVALELADAVKVAGDAGVALRLGPLLLQAAPLGHCVWGLGVGEAQKPRRQGRSVGVGRG